ncbi:MAG: glutaredoxin family protein [Deltaproteobacteria bacterium]|nr:glutaredoxin family protein [Deltaproteobacteria bacterium]
MKPLKLVLYTKPDCALCEPFKKAVYAVCMSFRWKNKITFSEINIESDPVYSERFGEKIPCLTINDKLCAKYKIEKKELQRKLKEAF